MISAPPVVGLHPWAVYNEFKPEAAEWIRELITMGLIAPGEVDERSIVDVSADDYREFWQCHFFAGIGTWSYCLRAAGIADSFPVITGSPPCQPFSVAGEGKGAADERHLAPKFADLVEALDRGLVFGEQVSSSDVVGKTCSKRPPVILDAEGNPEPVKWAWFDDLSDRLERALHTCGSSDLPAAGFGAPHIRQRLLFWAISDRLAQGWVCHTQRAGLEGLPRNVAASRQPGWIDTRQTGPAATAGRADGLADDSSERVRSEGRGTNAGAPRGVQGEGLQRQRLRYDAGHDDSGVRQLADAERQQRLGWRSGEAIPAPGSVERTERLCDACGVADLHGERFQVVGLPAGPSADGWVEAAYMEASGRGEDVELADGWEHITLPDDDFDQRFGDAIARLDAKWPGPTNGWWRDADWLYCRDEKWRPVEPGSQPLVNGSARGLVHSGDPISPEATSEARKQRLEGYGNGIVTAPTVAAIKSALTVFDREFPGWRDRAISLAESSTILAS